MLCDLSWKQTGRLNVFTTPHLSTNDPENMVKVPGIDFGVTRKFQQAETLTNVECVNNELDCYI